MHAVIWDAFNCYLGEFANNLPFDLPREKHVSFFAMPSRPIV